MSPAVCCDPGPGTRRASRWAAMLKAHAARIAALILLAAAVAVDYTLMARVAREIAGHPIYTALGGGAMGNSNSVPGIPPDMQVRLRLVPEKEQRYDTAGDWLWHGDTLEIRVSSEVSQQDPRYATLLFVHELIEAMLCRGAGVTAAQVDSFDLSHQGEEEPGANPAAPYHFQHDAAQAAERALAKRLGVDWKAYVAALQR